MTTADEEKLIDCREAHEHATAWLAEAEDNVRRLGPSYHRDCRVNALQAERKRLVGIYQSLKSGHVQYERRRW